MVINYKRIFARLSLVLILIVGLGLRWIRAAMEYGNELLQITTDKAIELYFLAGDLGYGVTITKLIGILESNNFFLYGQSYYRIFFTPIPRAIWPDKPENSQQIVADIVGSDQEFKHCLLVFKAMLILILGGYFF